MTFHSACCRILRRDIDRLGYTSNFTIYEVGRKLLDTGVIPTGDMTTEAAVTKLMWALGQTDDPEEVRNIFSTNLVGEISTDLL